jgi:hypothetical protein
MTTSSRIFLFCPTKIGFFGRVWWVPEIHFHKNPNILGDIGTHAKFQSPMITPSGRKVTTTERGEKERKTPLMMVT